MELLAVHY